MILRKVTGAVVIILVLICVARIAWPRIDERLQPIGGTWVHKASNEQVWTYKFKSSKRVYFSIDRQSARWTIDEIKASGNTVRIRVDDPGVGTISVMKSGEDSAIISSRLHCAMKFKR